ncbi:4-alpha-glucanotransferase [Protofrankia symbiont of Coriaria ruscifolia]|uniref:4-alpha-glucanotransferase n=1 Tax=Protofrankia symbiont of Coriaria ruscifolia TaxID=1306542 RepID=UPI001A94D12F|nr:4-alpha-glucanotransferase [Protofrankia symbiont of Coriaria ruscifolia]
MASDDTDIGTGTDTDTDTGTGTDAGAGSGTEIGTGISPARQVTGVDPLLAELAAVYGVATRYVDADDREVTVDPDVVRAVLGLLDVDTANPAAALAAARDAPWRRPLPACVIVRRSVPAPVIARVPVGTLPLARLEFESGGLRDLTEWGEAVEHRTVDGQDLVGVPLTPPAGLPLGDHVLRVRAGAASATARLVVVPDAVPDPAGAIPTRTWGWMIQLYALRSAGSWGMGDYADLAELAVWSGSEEGRRADVLLVNPLHAVTPTLPIEPSPYFPASRRFASPLYLRPQDLPEYAHADAATRARVDQLAATARAEAGTELSPGDDPRGDEHGPGRADLLDRDAVWRAKRAALELLFSVSGGGTPTAGGTDAAGGMVITGGTATAASTRAGHEDGHGNGCEDGHEEGHDGLTDFATWCALAERHGPDWRLWPAQLHDPRSSAVADARVELRDRVAFHRWLQHACDAALATAQAAARDAGMAVGIVHDLAVGVDPGGADAWALQDVFAAGATVGAPPDGFNQQGQDWALPPWRPDRLAETGYAPFRQMVAAVLRRGGGLRVDHILGLFRLWWIPAGNSASQGTYVRYDADAMLGLLALEAARAGALVVGEDLGTVESSVAARLARAGVLGSTVAWFERDADGGPLPPRRWREPAMASITTHDLPTVAGYLTGEHVRVRARRGLLRRSEEAELQAWRRERDALIALLQGEGLLAVDLIVADPADLPRSAPAPGSSPGSASAPGSASGSDPAVGLGPAAGLGPSALREVAFALHGLLARSPSRIVLAAPGDALGDLRQPNLPGTVDSYPNWRLPVTDADGRPVTVERLRVDPQVRRLARLLACVREQDR